jgi:glyoxylase I family protein
MLDLRFTEAYSLPRPFVAECRAALLEDSEGSCSDAVNPGNMEVVLMARNEPKASGKPEGDDTGAEDRRTFVVGLWGVRYQVKDVARSVAFYTQQLGLALDQHRPPAFAQVSCGDLKLILSGPGASGSRPMPNGKTQEPGGWNRVILQVADLEARIAELKQRGLRFRNEMEVGPGGKQIQLEDPDGNPIELFEPAR